MGDVEVLAFGNDLVDDNHFPYNGIGGGRPESMRRRSVAKDICTDGEIVEVSLLANSFERFEDVGLLWKGSGIVPVIVVDVSGRVPRLFHLAKRTSDCNKIFFGNQSVLEFPPGKGNVTDHAFPPSAAEGVEIV